MIVESRCATIITVRPTIALSMAACTKCSLSASSADVASSKRSIRGFTRRARAMAILCFWPPESFTPLSPTIVSNFSGHSPIKSSALASRQTSSISFSLTSLSTPYATFSRTVIPKSCGSCWT
mmetsp:Transcript_31729/g.54119  ORF Transcript_31729/g.54119 Transcript_31729/m.54119 type:complete len:123 (+) Transcript_31729:516-884(+)